jgi:hypothetical protein
VPGKDNLTKRTLCAHPSPEKNHSFMQIAVIGAADAGVVQCVIPEEGVERATSGN